MVDNTRGRSSSTTLCTTLAIHYLGFPESCAATCHIWSCANTSSRRFIRNRSLASFSHLCNGYLHAPGIGVVKLIATVSTAPKQSSNRPPPRCTSPFPSDADPEHLQRTSSAHQNPLPSPPAPTPKILVHQMRQPLTQLLQRTRSLLGTIPQIVPQSHIYPQGKRKELADHVNRTALQPKTRHTAKARLTPLIHRCQIRNRTS